MYCIYVWRPLMEASSTHENVRPPVVSGWSQKVNICLRLQSQNILLHLLLKYPLTILNIANVHVVKHNSVCNYFKEGNEGGRIMIGWGGGAYSVLARLLENIIYL